MILWILLVMVCACLGSVAQVLMKRFPIDLSNLWNIGLYTAVGLYGVALVAYLFALRHLPVNVAYPLIALSYPLVLILSYLFLNEKVLWFNWLGAIVIIGGIYLMFLK